MPDWVERLAGCSKALRLVSYARDPGKLPPASLKSGLRPRNFLLSGILLQIRLLLHLLSVYVPNLLDERGVGKHEWACSDCCRFQLLHLFASL